MAEEICANHHLRLTSGEIEVRAQQRKARAVRETTMSRCGVPLLLKLLLSAARRRRADRSRLNRQALFSTPQYCCAEIARMARFINDTLLYREGVIDFLLTRGDHLTHLGANRPSDYMRMRPACTSCYIAGISIFTFTSAIASSTMKCSCVV